MDGRVTTFLLCALAVVYSWPMERENQWRGNGGVVIVDTQGSRKSGFGQNRQEEIPEFERRPGRPGFEGQHEDQSPGFGRPGHRDQDRPGFFFNPFSFDEGDDAPENWPSLFPTYERPNFGGMPSFDNFWKQMQDSMVRMRSQIEELYRRLYSETSNPDLVNLPPNYHNSTSETKNVNGTLITVNQTIDKQTTNNSQTFFHVQVVQVKPPEGHETSSDLPPNVKPEVNPEEGEEKIVSSTPAEIAEKDSEPDRLPDETNEP